MAEEHCFSIMFVLKLRDVKELGGEADSLL